MQHRPTKASRFRTFAASGKFCLWRNFLREIAIEGLGDDLQTSKAIAVLEKAIEKETDKRLREAMGKRIEYAKAGKRYGYGSIHFRIMNSE